MPHSLAETVKILAGGLPPALISPAYITQIVTVANHLPGAVTHFYGFECPLGDPAARADFLLCLNRAGRDALLAEGGRASLSPDLQTAPGWERLWAFCTLWANTLTERVSNVWLEFDVTGARGLPTPSCFFGEQLYAGDDVAWVLNPALQTLLGRVVPQPVSRQILNCVAALPDRAYIFQIGAMLGRQTDALRLCIREISPAHIPAYLAQIGWPGSTADLMSLVERLAGYVETIRLDIDVSDRIHPKIGLECYMADNRQPAVEPGWSSFLAYLVDAGLCRPAKRDGLLAYPGYLRQRDYGSLWPVYLQDISALIGGWCENILFKGLHHIKLVYQPGYPLAAKAYLYVQHNWLPSASPTRVEAGTHKSLNHS